MGGGWGGHRLTIPLIRWTDEQVMDISPDTKSLSTIEQYRQAYDICSKEPLASLVQRDMTAAYVLPSAV